MAHYHAHVRPEPKGAGAEHAQYIERGGRFKVERYGEIGRARVRESARVGRGLRRDSLRRRMSTSAPMAMRTVSRARPAARAHRWGAQVALVRAFVAEQLGERHAYAWAIHEPRGGRTRTCT